jgi:hypothetical protein
MQHGLPTVYHKRMPGIVATLEAHHGIRVLGQQINQLPFSFIAPLRADDDDVFSHENTL